MPGTVYQQLFGGPPLAPHSIALTFSEPMPSSYRVSTTVFDLVQQGARVKFGIDHVSMLTEDQFNVMRQHLWSIGFDMQLAAGAADDGPIDIKLTKLDAPSEPPPKIHLCVK